MSTGQLDTCVWNSGEGLDIVSIQVVPELIRLDEIIREGMKGKPYF